MNSAPSVGAAHGASAGPEPDLSPAKRWQMAGYASGNFGKNLLWSTADLTLLFLFTDVMGVTPGLAGTIILASLFINAIMDPVMGAMADRIRGPLGGAAPLILCGAPLSGLGFAVLYALPAAGPISLGMAVAALFAFRLGFAVMDTPHNAALVTLVRDPARRGELSSLRFVFSSLATLCVVAVIPALMAAPQADGSIRLAVTAMIAGAVSATVMAVAALSVTGADRAEQSWRLERPARNRYAAILRSPPVVMVLTLVFALSAGVPLYGKMIIYHASYVVSDPPRANTMLVAMIVGQIGGMPVWTFAMHRIGTSEALRTAIIAVIAVSAAMPFCGGQSAASDTAIALMFGFGAGGVYAIIWVIVAECADSENRKNDMAQTGLLFGLAIVLMKLGQGAGAFVSGQFMTLAGYVPHAAQNPDVNATITTILVSGPIIAGVSAMALLSKFQKIMKNISNASS